MLAAEESPAGEGGSGEPASEPPVSNFTVQSGSIIWGFAEEVGVGNYANGDIYVYDIGNGIELTAPFSTGRNGSMINVQPGLNNSQGWDDQMQTSSAGGNTYDEALNIGTQLPYTLVPGDAVVTVESVDVLETAASLRLQEAAVLTVVASTDLPAAGSFRPHFYGPRENRTHQYNESDLDYSILGQYPEVAGYGQFTMEMALATTRKPWIEYENTWASTYSHPINNQTPHGSNYGRELANDIAGSIIVLNSDRSDAEKRDLYVQCVQNGLDNIGAAQNGQQWQSDGGHNLGRKLSIVLASRALGDPSLVQPFDTHQDDMQIFVISQYHVDVTASGFVSDGGDWLPESRDQAEGKTEPYTTEMIGLPEWAGRAYTIPNGINAHDDARYRRVNGPAICRTALACRMFGGVANWGYQPYFDYADRYQSWIGLSNWTNALWDAYRSEL